MKRKHLIIFLILVLTLLLAACGSSGDTSSQDEAQDTAQEQTEVAEDTVHPYAWLGLQDMPECHYLDVLATNHYFMKSNEYIDGMSYVSKQTKAVDGINTYEKDEYNETYSIEGKVTTINLSNNTYMQHDASDLAEDAKENLESAMETGENRYGRNFKGTGTGTIPILSDNGDDAEYEYYEYDYPEMEASSGDTMIERYYLKDGDVFAIYTKTTMGDTEIASTEIIKKMSGKIPKKTFKLPDLSKYEKNEL